VSDIGVCLGLSLGPPAIAGVRSKRGALQNADLAKSGAYTVLVQKRITALADIRNNAAHGRPDQFTDRDVDQMMDSIENFVSTQL
jgi:hypothetical protein